ncbi:unnamed protein product, partial [Discosporangium mesarthrocarpum]
MWWLLVSCARAESYLESVPSPPGAGEDGSDNSVSMDIDMGDSAGLPDEVPYQEPGDDPDDEDRKATGGFRQESHLTPSSESAELGEVPSKAIFPPIKGLGALVPVAPRGASGSDDTFLVADPGRAPFSVRAVASDPLQAAELQGLLPKQLEVDGRVSMTNLNGTLKGRLESSVMVLILVPDQESGRGDNAALCRSFCKDFSTYKGEGRVGYCFKQFDKRAVEFLYLVPPSLALRVPLLARTVAGVTAADGYLCCMVMASHPQQHEPPPTRSAPSPPGPSSALSGPAGPGASRPANLVAPVSPGPVPTPPKVTTTSTATTALPPVSTRPASMSLVPPPVQAPPLAIVPSTPVAAVPQGMATMAPVGGGG